jgi:hypothetical protein
MMNKTKDLKTETALCTNCGALSRNGYAIPEGRCGGVDYGTTAHEWVVPEDEIESFDDPTTFQPQSTELESTATGDHIVRFAWTGRDPMVTFCLWAEDEFSDAPQVMAIDIPGDVATKLARRPESTRCSTEVEGVTVWVSASLGASNDSEPAKDGTVVTA